MIFITDELGKFEKNIIELAENMGFKECKTIEAIDLFCGISEKNDVLKEKDRYYAFIDMHNAYYTADTNTFKESEYADMAEALNLTLAMPHLIDEALAMQKKAAVAADATDYMEILHL